MLSQTRISFNFNKISSRLDEFNFAESCTLFYLRQEL